MAAFCGAVGSAKNDYFKSFEADRVRDI